MQESLDSVGHLVEGRRQRPQFVLAVQFDAGLQVTTAESLHRLLKPLDGLGEMTRKNKTEQNQHAQNQEIVQRMKKPEQPTAFLCLEKEPILPIRAGPHDRCPVSPEKREGRPGLRASNKVGPIFTRHKIFP